MQDIQDRSTAVNDLARQLLEYEADQLLEPQALSIAIEQVAAKFRHRLVDLIGQTGFVALFGRALHLARCEMSILGGISIDADAPNVLQGAREVALANASDAAAAFSAIIAHFIWLLITFIGEQLGMHLVADIWPQVVQGETAQRGIVS